MLDKINSEKILKKALKAGGEFSELFYESSKSIHLECEDKKIDTIEGGIDSGIGLRTISDFETVYASTNKCDEISLLDLAGKVARSIEGKKHQNHFSLRQQKPQIILKSPHPSQISLDQKIKLILDAEKKARAMDKRIVQVNVIYRDLERTTQTLNSFGEWAPHHKSLSQFSVTVTVSDNHDVQTGYDSIGGQVDFDFFNPEKTDEVILKALRRALNNLIAKRAIGGTMPVVISSEAGGTLVHEAVGHGLEADLIEQGLSVYENKIGKKVASSLITIVDDPTLPNKRGSYSFDDEGTASTKTVLIENGILKSYMHSRLTAMKMGVTPNGHGRRHSYEFKPIVRMSNTMILPGKENPQKIIASVKNGLFVKMMGGGEVNTVNGDFMFEVTEGHYIENGKIGEPVRGATLTGNGPEILKSIDMVGNDLGFSIGTCGKDGQDAPITDAMPTVRIPEMVVGGVV